MAFGGSIKLTGESEYRKALTQITQNLKVVSAEMKATTTAFESGDKSVDELARDTANLKSALATQKQALATLKQELSKATAEYEKAGRQHKALVDEYDREKSKLAELEKTVGTASKEYKDQQKVVDALTKEVAQSEKEYEAQGNAVNKMKIQTANAETTLNKTAIALDKVGDEATETAKETEQVGTSMQSAEKSSSGMSEGFTVAKGVMANLATEAINLAAGALTALVGGLKNVADATVETINKVGELGDEIDKESQKIGISASLYQSLDYAMQRSGASIDDVRMGMRNITNAIADTENGVANASAKFDALGISLHNADGSMKSSEDVLLETIDVLASMTDETQRNAAANDIFGRSYQELKPLLNTGADGIRALMDEAQAYGMVMSDEAVKASAAFEDSLLKMNNTLDGIRNNVVGGFLPGITDLMDGFTDLTAGNAVASVEIERGLKKLSKNVKSLLPNVTDFVKEISGNIKDMTPEIASAISETLPVLTEAGSQILVSVLQGLIEATPTLLGQIPLLVETVGQCFLDNIEPIMSAGFELAEKIGEGIMSGLPTLISQLPDFVKKYVEEGKKVWTKAGEMGADLIKSVVNGINESLPVLTAVAPQVIKDFADGISQESAQIVEIAKIVMETLSNGLITMLPLITDFVIAMINVWSDVVSNNLPVIVQAGISILEAVLQGITQALPELLEMAPSLILSVAQTLLENLPLIATAGAQIVVSLISGINSMMLSLAQSALQMAKTVLNKLATIPVDVVLIGMDIVEGLWEGIKSKSAWLADKIDDFCSSIKDKIKEKFKIESPSKVMRDEVGKYLAEGIGVGFEDSMADVTARMQDAIPTNFDLNPTLTTANGYTASDFSYESMVSAFKEALTGVKVEMDDEEMGRFVDKTVSNLVFA